MPKKKAITTPKGKVIGPYSMAIEAGDLVFVSGQIPLDAATGKLVDGAVNLVGHLVAAVRAVLRLSQTGSVRSYAALDKGLKLAGR